MRIWGVVWCLCRNVVVCLRLFRFVEKFELRKLFLFLFRLVKLKCSMLICWWLSLWVMLCVVLRFLL